MPTGQPVEKTPTPNPRTPLPSSPAKANGAAESTKPANQNPSGRGGRR